ncbi:rhamnulokinase [Demequina salsinemoris]|uniref:rhamnulokinase n=1 Tax=Demequina salsinemoris TaxID=577470 RepID=UPI000785D7C7|nr:rhamnulokinase family protein [Demequina salsinemoris]
MSAVSVAAVDLGATSGRVMVGRVGPNTLELEQAGRFPNGPLATPDGLHWNVQQLYAHVVEGLRSAAATETIASIGIDSWAVDYALLRGDRVLGEPFHYRDERTAHGVKLVHADEPFSLLYARNGLQFLPFNTLYQLAVEREVGMLDVADRMLLVPDLIAWYLTGATVAESTNASTTGLLDVSTKEWDGELIDRLRLPRAIFPRLVQPGETIATVLPHVVSATGLAETTPVIAVGSHDTASAVVATPMTEPGGAYISCGTWGLVGVETEAPVLSTAAREANFTNEGGVDGRTRFLHNVMGLWLLNETVAAWSREDGAQVNLVALLGAAAEVTGEIPVFDANDPRFSPPGDMSPRIAAYCEEHGMRAPQSRAEIARSIVESLATAFAEAVRTASSLSGQEVRRIHMVGGGSQGELLCQRTADLSGLPVVAGPIEATAIGNVLVQARALGAVGGTLESMRDLVARAFSPRSYAPRAHAVSASSPKG